jgi:hypothetical protein
MAVENDRVGRWRFTNVLFRPIYRGEVRTLDETER